MESIGLGLKNGRFLTHGSCASASEVHEWDMLISVLYPLERSAVVRSGQDPSRKFVNADNYLMHHLRGPLSSRELVVLISFVSHRIQMTVNINFGEERPILHLALF